MGQCHLDLWALDQEANHLPHHLPVGQDQAREKRSTWKICQCHTHRGPLHHQCLLAREKRSTWKIGQCHINQAHRGPLHHQRRLAQEKRSTWKIGQRTAAGLTLLDQVANIHLDQVANTLLDQVANIHLDQVANIHLDQVANIHLDQVVDIHPDHQNQCLVDRSTTKQSQKHWLIKVSCLCSHNL